MNVQRLRRPAFTAAMILLFLTGCGLFSPVDLSFETCDCSTEDCGLDLDPYSAPYEGVLESTWTSEDTLVVEGYAKANCCASINGDYRLEGNELVLTYRASLGPLGACL